MSAKDSNVFVSIDEAAVAATRSTGFHVTRQDLKALIEHGILPNFGTEAEPQILERHATLLAGHVGTPLELATASLRLKKLPSDSHLLLILSPNLAVSFDPVQVSKATLQAFILTLRERSKPSSSALDWSRTMTPLHGGFCVWSGDASEATQWAADWEIAASSSGNTTMAESLCVPMLYGNKGRLTPFIVTAVRQHLDEGMPICDLMAGTGLVTRRLLSNYPVHANDAALFAATLAASQSVSIDEERAKQILDELLPVADNNLKDLKELFGQAFAAEEEFLLGGFSARRLEAYQRFASGCTRFVPEYQPAHRSSAWNIEHDAQVRSKVIAAVTERRREPGLTPFLLATAYWGNCYFGLRQAAEIDSIRFAITRTTHEAERPLLEAILMATADGCASGPHYAQPPAAKEEPQLKDLIERRAKSIRTEFEDRLSISCRRPRVRQNRLSITNLNWRDALEVFTRSHRGSRQKGVYVDPPYTRLQYSRFYHVFDTLLRYDYPACVGIGRTSEMAKRFSSRFDSREPSVIDEFHCLFRHLKNAGATLFLSYSTGGTVSLDRLLRLSRDHFSRVEVYAIPLQHHSQGVKLVNRGHRVEVLIVGKV